MGTKPKWDWGANTLRFTSCDPGRRQPAVFQLQQVDDDEFELLEPFRYTCTDGTVMVVDHQWLGRTDLASIPTYLGWFTRRHGRYTPAALMHDQLIPDRKPTRPPPPVQRPPVEADLEFRQALRASEVALVKSWVLWTGVTLGTRMLRLGLLRAAAMVVWFAAALAGTGLLVYGLLGNGWWALAALVAPVPFAFLWGRQWPAGLVAGYSFWPVLVGSLPGLLVYQVYKAIEWLAKLVGERLPVTRDAMLPAPDPFRER
jgi:Protein of unknown function (DUF1353)